MTFAQMAIASRPDFILTDELPEAVTLIVAHLVSVPDGKISSTLRNRTIERGEGAMIRGRKLPMMPRSLWQAAFGGARGYAFSF